MADLENSARKLLRATYTPLKSNQESRPSSGQALAKRSFVATLQITPDELQRLKERHNIGASASIALDAVVMGNGWSSPLETAPLLAEVDWQSLISIGEMLIELREQDIQALQTVSTAILDAFERDRRSGRAEAVPRAQGDVAPRRQEGPGEEIRSAAGAAVAVPLGPALAWAVASRFNATEAVRIFNLLPQGLAVAAAATKADFERFGALRIRLAQNVVAAMKQYPAIEPVGLLHLERLNFVPAGIERGELEYSVPLSPGEEVNISHKEWSNTSEEFSKLATDFMEAYSEEGVAEKSELMQSSSAQEQHSSGFNTGVTASGGYGPITMTTSLAVNVADSASQSEQSARNHSLTTTRKASSRSKTEHKTSFKVASAAGTEDQQVRKIKNPYPDKATRVDYYQLVRKWRVDLYRYGLRLTYDVMIPEPGFGILAHIQAMQDIQDALEMPFGDPLAPKDSPAYFPWQFDTITDQELMSLAAQYGATGIDPYPGDGDGIKEVVVTAGWVAQDDATHGQELTQTVTIPEGSVVSKAEVTAMTCDFWKGDQNTDNEGTLTMVTPLNVQLFDPGAPDVGSSSHQDKGTPFTLTPWEGRGGDLQITVIHSWISLFNIDVNVTFSAASGALQTWRMKTYAAIREAAEKRYEEYRQALKDKLARLQEELGGQDPLSLRKIEREEVMKGVLRWLFGPRFEFAPDLPTSFAPSENVTGVKNDPWAAFATALAMGEISQQEETVKFLHHAIEWENMLYFLYPYFWSNAGRWDFKKYLDHPDPMHRVFLKSGAARVVLTIRPGFESAFVSFAESGKPGQSPYVEIAQEMEAYANTNYPGIRAANPIEDARPLLSPLQRKAWKEMQDIMAVLEAFNSVQHVANPDLDPAAKAYPTTTQGLAALALLVPLVDANGKTVVAALQLTDPWGNPYVYTSPGVYNDYDLMSYGEDTPGGTDEAAHIKSWADANLIGRWYEYTPTSALDIAFDETLPDERPATH